MTTSSSPSQPSRTPWIIAGILGCLVVCLLLVIVGVGAFAIGGGGLLTQGQPKAPAPSPVAVITRAPAVPTVASISTQPTPPPTQMVAQATAQPKQPTATAVVPTAATLSQATPTPVTKALPTQPPVAKGKLAYSVCEGNCDGDQKKTVWVANLDGSGARRLVERASEPTFSPDGSQIAYYHYSDGIYLINTDGTVPSTGGPPAQPPEPGQKPTPIAGKKILGDSNIGFIEWSHDGRWVAFSSRPGGSGNVSIDVVPPDGTVLKDSNLRRTVVVGIGPSWSPDDTQIAFHTCRGNCGIYKSSSAPGSDAVPVVMDNGNAPAWSPDGKKIVYQADIDGARQLVLINADGSGKKQLTSGAVMHVGAAWSPDGGSIFYRSPEGGSWAIWRMNADGSNPVKIIDNVPPVDWAFERLAISK